jgi:hypothetical protein
MEISDSTINICEITGKKNPNFILKLFFEEIAKKYPNVLKCPIKKV